MGSVLLSHTSSVTRIDSSPALFILPWLPGQALPKPNHKVCYWSRAVPAGAITWPVLFNFIQSRLLLLLQCVTGTQQPMRFLLGTSKHVRTRKNGNVKIAKESVSVEVQFICYFSDLCTYFFVSGNQLHIWVFSDMTHLVNVLLKKTSHLLGKMATQIIFEGVTPVVS